MADYPISKEAVQKMLIDLRSSLGNERYISIGISMALHNLEGFPQMDAVPEAHGYWLYGDEYAGHHDVDCSVCGDSARTYYDYCPNCGAKMDAKEE